MKLTNIAKMEYFEFLKNFMASPEYYYAYWKYCCTIKVYCNV
jgi:hypothetical protein